ncbi:sensor histidine kinase [Streptomyces sp. BI20]|uniref:sensor histidine kinase n=1 Tax=Streptomyces sp. BI20 TaxID=3403460 RepID=UPI003C738ACF
MTDTGDTRGERAGPLWWERRRDAVLDGSLALLSATECAFEGVDLAHETALPVFAGVAFGTAVGATLLLRRRAPVLVALLGVAVSPAAMGFLLGVVGLYTLAASQAPRRVIASVAGLSVAATLVVTWLRTRHDIEASTTMVWVLSAFVAVALTVPPLLFGLYVGERRRLMESLRERADSLERELGLLADRAEERAEWARTEERNRIARDMHDVVAHRVSLMVVHATALQAVAVKDPERAARNAALVGDMGRQALTELREMLGVLRSGTGTGTGTSTGAGANAPVAARPAHALAAAGPGPGAAPAPTGPAAPTGPTAPAAPPARAPDLGELAELVGLSRAAGMRVEFAVHGEPPAADYPPDVRRAVYRVVQEALTNCHKHAGGAAVVVRLAHREAELALQVENGPRPADGSAPTAASALPSGGNGLLGMRERVLALGGVFVSGDTDAGGFRVSAVLPKR